MKQLLFLLLFPCLALAQYQTNGNQKITLGEQTTADGLVYRGNAADTVAATLKITKTNKSDTSAFLLLDTINNVFLKYNIGTTFWTRLNILPTDTASMLGNYWRSGRFSGILPVANGGTNNTSYISGAIPYSNGTSLTSDTSRIFFDNTNIRFGLNTTNFTDPIAAFSKVKFVDGTMDLSFRDNATGQGYLAVGSRTNNIKGFLGHTNTEEGFTMGTFSNHDVNIRSNNISRIRIKDAEVRINTPAINTDRGAYNLQVNGTGVWGAGDYVNGSDLNIKDNIQNLDSSLYLINLLAPVMYNYKEEYNKDESKQIGFIAQDVYNVLSNTEFSNAIVKSDGDTLSMAYSSFIPLLTKAIQEQQSLIKALEQRILILENK